MCFGLSPCCSRKGEENGNPPSPGKVVFTCCVSTQTLERVFCSGTYKAPLARAASNEAGCWTTAPPWFCLSLQRGFTPGAWRCSAGTPSHPAFPNAAGCRSAPLPAWLWGPLHLAELSSVRLRTKSLPPGCGEVMEWAVTQEPVTREKTSPFCKPESLPPR